MSPRETGQYDPMHRPALVTAYEALERAGCVRDRGIAYMLRGWARFTGQLSDDSREVKSWQDISVPEERQSLCLLVASITSSKFWGPTFSVDTACSSRLAAVQSAGSPLSFS